MSYNEALIHQTLNHFIGQAHTGSKAQKSRSMVSGGGRKPWRQKGTGNARVGSSRNPLWRGGGRAFAATPNKRKRKLNKKMYQQAMCSLISEIHRQGRLQIVDTFEIEQPKTRLLIEKLKSLSLGDSVLIVEEENRNVFLAANNIPTVGILGAGSLDPFSLLRFDKVLFTRSALEKFQGRFQYED